MSAVVRTIKKCYLAEIQFLNRLQPVLLLLLRLYIGYGFFKSGWGKLQNISITAEYFAGLGIPLPVLNAYLAGATECSGGLLLLLGAASRVVTIPMIFTMIIAYSTQHIDELRTLWTVPPGKNYNPAAFFKAAPFLYLLTSLFVLLFGPGLFSIDGLLKWFLRTPNTTLTRSASEESAENRSTPRSRFGFVLGVLNKKGNGEGL